MRKALVVGIDKYAEFPLMGCCNDARAMAELLKRHGDVEKTKNFSVEIRLDTQRKSDLLGLIKDCFSGDADVALFYYAGHGCIDSIGGYLVTPDYRENDPGVSLGSLLKIINNSKCKDKIVILDSCYSGAFGDSEENSEISKIGEGVTILTSCRKYESSAEGKEHGIFTSLLIDGLEGAAADIMGHITPGGLYAYIDKSLGAWAQRPVFKTNVTRFTSLRNVIPQVDLLTIRRICEYFRTPNDEFRLNPSFEQTNSPLVEHKVIEPFAKPSNVRIFKDLQKLESVGLVIPKDAEHMYFAAMESKSCILTSLGKVYWKFVNEEII